MPPRRSRARSAAILALACLAAGCPGIAGNDPALLGAWVSAGPLATPPERWDFAGGGSATRLLGDFEVKLRFVVYPNASPRGVDLTFPNGLTSLGIYRVDGPTLKLCYMAAGVPRPGRFPANGDPSVVTLRRRGD